METPREIPGFFYDTVKRKYFKIESSRTAPPSSRWSSESVKRQKVEKQQATKQELIVARRKLLVRRSQVLQDPLLGGLLERNFGRHSRDLQVDSWARTLHPRGCLRLHQKQRSANNFPATIESSNLDHLVVTNQTDGKGRITTFGATHTGTIQGRYMPTDDYGSILDDDHYQDGDYYYTNLAKVVSYESPVSAMKYHEPSNTVLMTSHAPRESTSITIFAPDILDISNTRTGLQDGTNFHRAGPPPTPNLTMNTCEPAPVGSELLAVLGTNRGILKLSSEMDRLKWVNDPEQSSNGKSTNDVLSLSFMPKNPHVIFAGSRDSRVSWVDLRAPEGGQCGRIRHRSSVAHVRGINEHQVLAAGPKSAMSIYDIRFAQRPSMKKVRNMPLVRFSDYSNTASIQIGLDVDLELGVVAAATEDRAQAQDGRLYLYSLNTGKQLDCPALEKVRVGRVLKAVVFQRMPWEDPRVCMLG